MKKFNPNNLINLLKNAKVDIVFTKQDGSEREMLCTLQDAYLPVQEDHTSHTKASDMSTLVVWDLEADDWRSFKVDSLKYVRVGGIPYSPEKSKLLA